MATKQFNFNIAIQEAQNGGFQGRIGAVSFAVGSTEELTTYLTANNTYLTSQQIADINTAFGITS
jgi:hypothetical protein